MTGTTEYTTKFTVSDPEIEWELISLRAYAVDAYGFQTEHTYLVEVNLTNIEPDPLEDINEDTPIEEAITIMSNVTKNLPDDPKEAITKLKDTAKKLQGIEKKTA